MVPEKFGRWKAYELVKLQGNRARRCICECGTERVVLEWHLKNSRSMGCGCGKKTAEHRSRCRHMFLKHGRCNSNAYGSWRAMLSRCNNRKHNSYPAYGGRGIRVCGRWQTFENFLVDMGDRPAGMSLDRINNDGNYEPGNCRWATAKEQARNTRIRTDAKFGVVAGKRYRVKELAEKSGLSVPAIRARIKNGWIDDRLIAPDARGGKPGYKKGQIFVILNGRKVSISNAAREHNLRPVLVFQRIKRGFHRKRWFLPPRHYPTRVKVDEGGV